MKQPQAMPPKGMVAPYNQIPEFKLGMTLLEEVTALYLRLSNEDKDKEKKDDSNSIANQKKILAKFAQDNNLPNPVFFVDDGYTGTTFNRPGLNEMLTVIRTGKVSTVVIKDQSRIGRDVIEIGLLKRTFDEFDVRFMSAEDGLDTAKGFDIMSLLRDVFNEWYVADCSKKIRAVKRMKGMAGEPMSVHAHYGLMKDPENPKHRIVDEEAAEVVRQIFRDYVAGLGSGHIAAKLREERIDTPTHRAMRLGRKPNVKPPEIPWDWNTNVVMDILQRREYLGHTVNFKTQKKSYKSKKITLNDPSEYVVFENTHEAIIDQDTFDRVQQLLAAGKRRRNKSGRVSLFSGLAYCADCGSKMIFCSGESKKPEQDDYVCSGFRTKKRVCDSSHYIRRVVLEQLVLEQIQQITAFATEHEQKFTELLRQDQALKSRKELADSKRKIAQSERRIAEVDNIVQRLYEDYVSNRLSEDRFLKLSRSYENEQRDLAEQTASLAKQISEQEQQSLDLERFLKQVRQYTHVTELTPTLLNELVERIAIHKPDKSSGKRIVDIDVYFNFVGLIDTSGFLKTDESEIEMQNVCPERSEGFGLLPAPLSIAG